MQIGSSRPNFVPNPLRRHGNVQCPCPRGEVKKVRVKACCGRVPYVPLALAEKYLQHLVREGAPGLKGPKAQRVKRQVPTSPSRTQRRRQAAMHRAREAAEKAKAAEGEVAS